MANFDSLPPELIIHLFKYLSSDDRKIASEVCHYWHDIWMEGAFDGDRTLKFYCCELNENTEPGSVLLNTDRKYKKIVFGANVKFYDDCVKLSNALEDIKTIEFQSFFDYKQFFSKTMNFIGLFKELKELTFNIETWSHEMNEFGNLPDSIQVFTLSLLNRLYFKDTLDNFKSIIWQLPNLKELNLECQLLTDDLFEFIITSPLPYLTKLKLTIDSNCIELLKNLKLSNLVELFLVIEDPTCIRKLDEIIPNFPKLKIVKLHTFKLMPTTTHAHLIKYLKVTDINCGMDYIKPLQYLTELEELDLMYYFKSVAQGSCFFAHDLYLNPNLKRLQLTGFNNNDLISLMCFENLVKSFPNLESLIMDMPLSSQHLQMIHQNFTKLKSLDIRNTDVDSKYIPPFQYLSTLTALRLDQYVISNQALTEWPEMPHLRVLTMKLDHEYSLECFRKMIQNVRGLEKLTFDYNSSIDDDLIKVIAENLKRLKEIEVTNKQKTKYLSGNAIILLLTNCKYMQRISFPLKEVIKTYYTNM